MAKLRLLPDDPEIGWMPYAWLVYLPFQIPALVVGAGTRLDWTVTFAGMAVFLVLYFRSYWACGRGALAYGAAMALLGAIVVAYNPWASSYFVYAAACIASSGTARFAWRVLGCYLVALGIFAWATHLTPYSWVTGIVFSGLVGALRIQSVETNALNASLRTAREDVERLAKVAERERIARDLHDVLGHTLSVIVLKSNSRRGSPATTSRAPARRSPTSSASRENHSPSCVKRSRGTVRPGSPPKYGARAACSPRPASRSNAISATDDCRRDTRAS
ncbi:MAG: hypothetical protein IAI48_04865 [Candidatus Eremiobacteraeota bacterium]|nr:hypothetical protein [Candidatus Eremiobacteraeota bacterium]